MVRRDPNKPRGRVSGYAFFVRACRQQHKRKHPKQPIVFSQFSKQCAEKWRGMEASKKKKFNDLSAKDGIRYQREMKHYRPSTEDTKKRRMKDPNAPKRPQSAFFLFCAGRRAQLRNQHPTWSVMKIAKKLGTLWAEASKEVKNKYSKQAEKEKMKYNRRMALYKKKQGRKQKLSKKQRRSGSRLH